MIGYSVAQVVAAGIIVKAYTNLTRGSLLSENHERRVDGNAREPGSEVGPAFEVAQVNKGSQQCVLNCVFGILTGSRYAMSSTKKLLLALSEYYSQASVTTGKKAGA